MENALYLLPSPLGEEGAWAIPSFVGELLNSVSYVIAENLKQARRNMRLMGFSGQFDSLTMVELNKDTGIEEVLELIIPLQNGESALYLSDAGCPGIADPGSLLTKFCHEFGIPVVPVPGPSSIFLGLMASGLNGQQFEFHGYLPIEEKERARAIKRLEQESRSQKKTQIFIETPYRNPQMIEALKKTLLADTLLCIAANLTLPTAYIKTQTVSKWKQEKITLKKQPTMFLIGQD